MLVNLQKIDDQIKDTMKLSKDDTLVYYDNLMACEKDLKAKLKITEDARKTLQGIVAKRFPKLFQIVPTTFNVKPKDAYSYVRNIFKDLR